MNAALEAILLLLFHHNLCVCSSGLTYVIQSVINTNEIQSHVRTTILYYDLRESAPFHENRSVELEKLHSTGLPAEIYHKQVRGQTKLFSRRFSHRFTVIVHVSQSHPTDSAFSCNNNCFYIIVCQRKQVELIYMAAAVRRLKFKLFLSKHPTSKSHLIYSESPYRPNQLVETSSAIIMNSELFPNQLQVRNKHLNVVGLEVEPTLVTENGVPILGISYEAFGAASKMLNFTYSMQVRRLRFFKHPNGSWGGYMGDLVEGRVDFLFATVAGNVDRHRSVEYATFGFDMGINFITRHPSPVIGWTTFLQPIQIDAWLALLILLLFLTVTVLMQLRRSQRSVSSAVLIVIAPLLGQEVRISPSLRISIWLWLFGSMVFCNYYTSNLLSYITHPSLARIPRTFPDLAEHSDFKIQMIDLPGAANEVFFNTSRHSAYINIRERYRITRNYFDCVARAATENKMACIGFSIHMFPIVHKHLVLLKGFEPVVTSARAPTIIFLHSVLQKDSKYTDSVNFMTGWTRDLGVIMKWNRNIFDYYETISRQWLRSKDGAAVATKLREATLEGSRSVVAFDVSHLYVAFGVILGGASISFMVFIWEVSWLEKFKPKYGKVMLGCL